MEGFPTQASSVTAWKVVGNLEPGGRCRRQG